jgi:hypothetical protein
MLRPLVLLVAVLVVSGCNNPGSSRAPTDPFFGRTRVAPPGTGAVAGQTGVPPYYPPQSSRPNPLRSPNSALGPAPAWTPPAAQPQPPAAAPTWLPPLSRPDPATTPAAVPSGGQYLPPGGSYGYPSATGAAGDVHPAAAPGDRIAIPTAAMAFPSPASAVTAGPTGSPTGTALAAEVAKGPSGGAPNPASLAPPTTSPGTIAASGWPPAAGSQQAGSVYGPTRSGTLATRERIDRTLQPRARGTANYLRNAPGPVDPASRGQSTAPPSRTRGPINLMDLPEARAGSS